MTISLTPYRGFRFAAEVIERKCNDVAARGYEGFELA